MPPVDEDVMKTPEEPCTPHDGAFSSAVRQHVVPPTAPKGKPRAPPLIHGKIKDGLNEEVPPSLTTGSKIPLFKTKHVEAEEQDHNRKLPYVSARNHSIKSSDVKSTSIALGSRSVGKVKLAKGVEMKRVVQESKGVKTKKYTSTCVNSKTSSASLSTKESSQITNNGSRKKMTKIEATFPDVKSFNGHIHPTGSGSSLTTKSNTNKAPNPGFPGDCEESHLKHKSNGLTNKISQVQMTLNTQTPAVEFKTVDEFLKMPITELPNSKSCPKTKKSVYKSKFWEYLDPKGPSTNSRSLVKEHKKPYDPNDVKTFMQKQKEIRKVQQIKESKEKEEEVAKRQRMLKELDTKCQKIAVRGKLRGYSDDGIVRQEDETKKPKLEMQSPSMKYLKPLLDRKQGSLLRKSDNFTRDVEKQSQYLLAEFENIVKRECISFLQKIPIPASETNIVRSTEKVDKAVATSSSLLDLNRIDSPLGLKENKNEDMVDLKILHGDLQNSGLLSPSTIEIAVTKIQAAYRGYKVRQTLKDARIFYRKPTYKRCSEILHQNANSVSNQFNPNRRWSFPRMPEKPYDNISKLLPMSPVPMIGKSSISSAMCYIPPPSSNHSPRSPARPRVLPSFPLTPVRVYDEPYPKQTKATTESGGGNNNNKGTPLPPKESAISLPPKSDRDAVEMSTQSTAGTGQMVPLKSSPTGFEFAVPSSLPCIIDVLREKLRLFATEKNDIAGVPPPNLTGSGKLESHEESFKEKVPTEYRSWKTLGKESGDVSSTTNDDFTRDHEGSATPKIKRHKRRSRSRSHRSPVQDSTSTIDTEMECIPSVTRSSMSVLQKAKNISHVSSNGSKSEEAMPSSTLDDPTTTSSFDNFLAPAVQLRYEAEREHLKIIEKALQVKLETKIPAATSADSIRRNEQSQQSGNFQVNKGSPETDRVQLAIANCHKESMKAAAEMAKWMSEFQKNTREQEQVHMQQAPIDLAATVIAAVEQARVIGIEKRKEKKSKEQRKQMEQEKVHHDNTRIPVSRSESRSSDILSKMDKSVETSLIIDYSKNLKKERKLEYVENAKLVTTLKDYQQQFPSESERDSPIPTKPAITNIAVPAPNLKESNAVVSRRSSIEEGVSKFQDLIDYPSIIPSGNSIDFSSLDPKVSTLEYASQLSSEREGSHGVTSAMLTDNLTDQPSSVQKLSEPSSIVEILSDPASFVSEYANNVEIPSEPPSIVEIRSESEKNAEILSEPRSIVEMITESANGDEIPSEIASIAEILPESVDKVETPSEPTSIAEAFLESADKVEIHPGSASIAEVFQESANSDEISSELSNIAGVLPESADKVEIPSDQASIAEVLPESADKVEIEIPSEAASIAEVLHESANSDEIPSEAASIAGVLHESANSDEIPSEAASIAGVLHESANSDEIPSEAASIGEVLPESADKVEILSEPESIVEMLTEQSRPILTEEEASPGPSIVNDAVSLQFDFIEDISSSQSKKANSIHSVVGEVASVHSSIEVDEGNYQMENKVISTVSNNEEKISVSLNISDEASQPSRKMDDLANSNRDNVESNTYIRSEVSEDISKHSHVEHPSPEKESLKPVSEKLKYEDNFFDVEVNETELVQRSESRICTEEVNSEIIQTDEVPSDRFETVDHTTDDHFDEDKAVGTDLQKVNEQTIEDTPVVVSQLEKNDTGSIDDFIEEPATTSVQKTEDSEESSISYKQDSLPHMDSVSQELQDAKENSHENFSIIEDVAHESTADISEDSSKQSKSQKDITERDSPRSCNKAENKDDVEKNIIEEDLENDVNNVIKDFPIDSSETVCALNTEDVTLNSLKHPEIIPEVNPSLAEEKDSVSSEAKIPSLDVSSNNNSFIQDENSPTDKQISNSVVAEGILTGTNLTVPCHASHQEENLQTSTATEENSEKSQFGDDSLAKSEIIDEASDQSERSENMLPHSEAMGAETISEIVDDSQNKTCNETNLQENQQVGMEAEFEIPLKPPPPYSPSSSLESTSLSSRSLIVSLSTDKLDKIAREQANLIWEVWKLGNVDTELFPNINTIMEALVEKKLIKLADETIDNNVNGNLQSTAEQSFDVVLTRLIYETMKDVLQLKNNYTSTIEQVRPGPLALQAQKLKIPKSKEDLVTTVLEHVLKTMPSALFSNPNNSESNKPRLRKWCSKPRELVDEILLEELIEEDYQWTEWWPEEVIISHHVSTKIIQRAIRNALAKRKYVCSQ